MQTVEKKEEKKPKAERDKAVTVSSISQKKKYQIDYFYCNAMRLSVIYAYSIASLVATKNRHHFSHISEPSKTCFSRFSKIISLYIDFQGQTQNNNYTQRQKYEQTMNKECVYLYFPF